MKGSSIYGRFELKEHLKSRRIHLNRKRGQNFLLDKNILKKIVKLSGVGKDDIVIEIGGGYGHLTEEILNEGCRVRVYEVDRKLVEVLNERFRGEARLEVIGGDFLKWDEGGGFDMGKKVKVLGNIPYVLSSRVVSSCLKRSGYIDSMVLMFQKEFGERILANPGEKAYSSLTLMCRLYAKVKSLMDVRRHVFFPVPRVDSKVIEFKMIPFEMKDQLEMERDWKWLEGLRRGLFMQRRKSIFNALCGKPLYLERDFVETMLRKLGLKKEERGECLKVKDIKKMLSWIKSSK